MQVCIGVFLRFMCDVNNLRISLNSGYKLILSSKIKLSLSRVTLQLNKVSVRFIYVSI